MSSLTQMVTWGGGKKWLKIVSRDDSCESITLQYPKLSSKFEKYFAPETWGRISYYVLMGNVASVLHC